MFILLIINHFLYISFLFHRFSQQKITQPLIITNYRLPNSKEELRSCRREVHRLLLVSKLNFHQVNIQYRKLYFKTF